VRHREQRETAAEKLYALCSSTEQMGDARGTNGGEDKYIQESGAQDVVNTVMNLWVF
jgi:hypothetical protein